jgi:hypothetical protein
MVGTRSGARGRSLRIAGATLVLGLATALPASAASVVRERFDYPLEFPGSVECGSFQDDYIDRYQVTEIDVSDASGNLLRVEYHAAHSSVDRNSVTGFALEEHGHFYQVDDFVAGTSTVSGNQEVANRQGKGVVIQDTGHQVFSLETGDTLFFAGGRNHSQVLLGEGIWCDALS